MDLKKFSFIILSKQEKEMKPGDWDNYYYSVETLALIIHLLTGDLDLAKNVKDKIFENVSNNFEIFGQSLILISVEDLKG
jgi:hypothetical protein